MSISDGDRELLLATILSFSSVIYFYCSFVLLADIL